ncbi:hypothetical protein WG922_16635 [Ramlibacter sp. AN1015]|uniref:hypothetical protein n=1 Tax=Ramlibacter sp. AN1015 TaxID=3133428 RepID=UPI0030C335B5
MNAEQHKSRTLAHQLTEIAAVYARSFAHWREDPADLSRYERTHANLELVRVLTEKAFPGGRGELGELLLCHTDLKLLVLRQHLVRRAAVPAREDLEEQLLAGQARHDRLVAEFITLCANHSGQPPAAPGGAGSAQGRAAPSPRMARARHPLA